MGPSIHGHEVMKLIHESDPPLSRDELHRVVAERWGPQRQFHACVADRMTLDGLLRFLAARGKVVEADGVLRTDLGLMCEHG